MSLRPGVVWPGLVTREQVFLAAKTAIAAGLAWVAALAADPHSRPYFAPLAVLLVAQPTRMRLSLAGLPARGRGARAPLRQAAARSGGTR